MKILIWSFFTADILMEKVTLNVNVPFINRLIKFYRTSVGENPTPIPPPSIPISDQSHVDAPLDMEPTFKMLCTVKEPEFVLFADPDKEDGRIMVMKVSYIIDERFHPYRRHLFDPKQ